MSYDYDLSTLAKQYQFNDKETNKSDLSLSCLSSSYSTNLNTNTELMSSSIDKLINSFFSNNLLNETSPTRIDLNDFNLIDKSTKESQLNSRYNLI